VRGAQVPLRPVEVRVPAQPLARFAELVDSAGYEGWRAQIQAAAEALRGRVVWHVSSTARGGGVAEMMGPLIGYARDVGVDARWMVIARDARVLRPHQAARRRRR
jgi:trehalose synthase